jgi:hypothetical protein
MESATTSEKAVDSAAAVMQARAVGTELARPAIHTHDTVPVCKQQQQQQQQQQRCKGGRHGEGADARLGVCKRDAGQGSGH